MSFVFLSGLLSMGVLWSSDDPWKGKNLIFLSLWLTWVLYPLAVPLCGVCVEQTTPWTSPCLVLGWWGGPCFVQVLKGRVWKLLGRWTRRESPLWDKRYKTWQLFSSWRICYRSMVDFSCCTSWLYFESKFCAMVFHPKGNWLVCTEAVEEAVKFTSVSIPLCLYYML